MKICKACAFLSFLIILLYSCALPPENEKESLEPDSLTPESPWTGETEKPMINTKEGVHLNDPQEDAETTYITILPSFVRSIRREFGVWLTFNPSANNYARFCLVSPSEILSGDLNSYYIQIGGTKDSVALYRQNGNQSKLLASGRELMKENNSPRLFIKVECDASGYWTFWTRTETGTEYTKEKQVKDASITKSICCGIYCVYTKSRCDGLTFHHIQLSDDVIAGTEPDDIPDAPDEPDKPDTPKSPEYPDNARNMLLFNEAMYDNAKDGAEYIGFYNPANQDATVKSLRLFKMRVTGEVFSTTILKQEDEDTSLVIPGKGYICFTHFATTLIRKHKVDGKSITGISKFPQLSNDGDYLALVTDEERPRTIDTCRSISWMYDTSVTIGIPLKKIPPELPSLSKNWHSSRSDTGGTPGIRNS